MTEPDVHTLTGPYVLDALPDDERERFEAHLAECTFCTTEVAELRAAAVKLATQVSTPPPPALKANVMSAIENVRQLPPVVHSQPAVRRRLSRRSLLVRVAAAGVVAVIGATAMDERRNRIEAERANEQLTAVLTQPDARTVHGAVRGGGQATVVVSAKADKSVVVLRDLPELPTNRTWQLWMIDRGQTAHSVGLASGDLTKVIDGSTAGMTTFGLTLEPNGGSPKPTLPAAALIPLT
jgi:anti-sigma-K factor RskA